MTFAKGRSQQGLKSKREKYTSKPNNGLTVATKIESDTLYFALQASLRNEAFLQQTAGEAFYWLNRHLAQLSEEHAQFKRYLAEETERFKRHLKEKLEWLSTHEEEANNAIFLTFCLLTVVSFIIPYTASMSIAKGNSWNLFEGLAVSLALSHNAATANSPAEKLILANNVIGTSALFACIPVCILIASGLALSAAIPHILVLVACYSDVISYGYSLYQAVKNNDPDVNQKALSFTSITLTAAGFTLLSAVPLFAACPPLALGLLIGGFICLGLSALIRTVQLTQDKSAKKTNAVVTPTNDTSVAIHQPNTQKTMLTTSSCFFKPPVYAPPSDTSLAITMATAAA